MIGAGLFVGSGAVINQTGPAAVLSYLAAGLLVVLVMRMLGEMAVAHPSTGSFADYAGIALGDWARFLVGWLYWYFWVIVLAVEAAAGAAIIQEWLPGVPIWASSLVLMLAADGRPTSSPSGPSASSSSGSRRSRSRRSSPSS